MRILSFSISLIISFLFLELFVRIYSDNGMNYEIEMMKYANNFKIISKNKKIGIEHNKNIKGYLMGANITLNENGFRSNKEYEIDSKKILMLGDSMTFGWGANKTFSSILDDNLKNYEVINAGIGNTNTIMQIENFFENFNKIYKYDIIILNFFINDFEDVKIIKPNFIQKNSFLYTYLSNKLNTVLIKFKINKNWATFYADSYKNNSMSELALKSIFKLNEYCKENKIMLIVNNIPELRDLKDYKFEKETSIVEKFAKKNNIYFINSHEALKDYKEEELWVTENDQHANDKAHQIIGDFINLKIQKFLN